MNMKVNEADLYKNVQSNLKYTFKSYFCKNGIYIEYVGIEVLTPVVMKSTIFWDSVSQPVVRGPPGVLE
jgi:hypothetical protein